MTEWNLYYYRLASDMCNCFEIQNIKFLIGLVDIQKMYLVIWKFVNVIYWYLFISWNDVYILRLLVLLLVTFSEKSLRLLLCMCKYMFHLEICSWESNSTACVLIITMSALTRRWIKNCPSILIPFVSQWRVNSVPDIIPLPYSSGLFFK